jgi:hypothetical protein
MSLGKARPRVCSIPAVRNALRGEARTEVRSDDGAVEFLTDSPRGSACADQALAGKPRVTALLDCPDDRSIMMGSVAGPLIVGGLAGKYLGVGEACGPHQTQESGEIRYPPV